MPPAVLCSGNIVHDTVVRPVEEVVFGVVAWVESIEQHLGGNGANTACALARLGVPVRLTGMVGRDAAGQQLLRTLESAGVDTRAVGRSEAPTPATVSLVNKRGERCLLHRPGASLEAFVEPLQFTPELLEGVAHYHLANMFALPNLRRHGAEMLRRARAAGLSTSLDTAWDARGRWLEDLAPALAFVDLLFVNETEARCLSGADEPAAAAAVFRQLGVRDVAVKLGERGCAVFTAGSATSVPAFEVPAVDTTGAGDCFAGAFLAAWLRGQSLAEAARFANAAAALAIQRLGSTGGLRSWEETLEWMKSAPVRPA
ncbi:MAG: carbohydrate kinase family protein [Acidobacteriota bacterium]